MTQRERAQDQTQPTRHASHQTPSRPTEFEDALEARPKTERGQANEAQAVQDVLTRLAGWKHVEGHQQQHGTYAHVLAGHHESHSMLLALAEPSSAG